MCTLLERTQSSYYPAFKSMLDSVDSGELALYMYALILFVQLSMYSVLCFMYMHVLLINTQLLVKLVISAFT